MDSSGSMYLVWVQLHVTDQEAVKARRAGYSKTYMSCHVNQRPFLMVCPHSMVWASSWHDSLRLYHRLLLWQMF